MDPERLQLVQHAGRRLGMVTFAIVVSAFVIVSSAQILYQGFRDQKYSTSGDCRAGVSRLVAAVRTARQAADRDDMGERAALIHFRAALAPEWRQRAAIEELCRSDTWAKAAILATDEWRWTEEIAVRYESADLAPSRRRAHAIEAKLDQPPTSR